MEGPHGRVLRWFLLRKPLTAARAGWAIAFATLAVTIAAGFVIRLLDPDDFDSVWLGLWWAVQTVTTVGYGDVVPHDASGRIVGAVLMLSGIAFLTVITATVTAALIETLRRRYEEPADARMEAKLDEVNARLERLETALGDFTRRG